MSLTFVERFVQNPQNLRLFLQERSIREVTTLIEDCMEELGVSRSELAQRLGKSKGWVTQLLDGEANKTIRTVADVFAVLGREFRSFHKPIEVSNAPKSSGRASGTLTRRAMLEPNPAILGIYDGTSAPAAAAEEFALVESA